LAFPSLHFSTIFTLSFHVGHYSSKLVERKFHFWKKVGIQGDQHPWFLFESEPLIQNIFSGCIVVSSLLRSCASSHIDFQMSMDINKNVIVASSVHLPVCPKGFFIFLFFMEYFNWFWSHCLVRIPRIKLFHPIFCWSFIVFLFFWLPLYWKQIHPLF